MKVTKLDNIKSNKLYKNINITSIHKKNSNDIMKKDCMLILSNNSDDFINILNNNLFKYSYYKNIFTFLRSTNNINAKYNRINLKEYYKNINLKLNQKRLYKKNITEYNKKNILVDCSNTLQLFYKFAKNKTGMKRVNLFTNNLIDNIIKKISNYYYKNLLLVIPISQSKELSEMQLNKYLNISNCINNSVQYFYHILNHKELLIEFDKKLKEIGVNDLTLLFYSTDSHISLKYNLSELIKDENDSNSKIINKSSYISKIKKLINSSLKGSNELEKEIELENKKDNNEDEQKITKKQELENRKIEKVDDILNSFVSIIKKNQSKKDYINTNSLTSKELEIIDKMTTKISSLVDENSESLEDDKTLLNKLNNDKTFLEYLQQLKDIETLGSSNIDAKKIEKLRNIQNNVKINNEKSIKDILEENEDIAIEEEDIPLDNKVIFDNVKKNKVKDFDRNYMNKSYRKDILRTLSSFNEDKDLPLYIEDIKIENTSDNLTLKETYTVIYRDTNNVKHTLKIDLPIVIEDKYIYINGSKKLIQKQLMAKPIIKSKPDRVQITSDYNKLFIERFGNKLSENTEILKKIFTNPDINNFIKDKDFKFRLGNISDSNRTFKVNIYYSYISSFLFSLNTSQYVIEFDYNKLKNMIQTTNNILYDKKLAMIEFNEDYFQIIGYTKDKNELLLIEKETNKVKLYNNENLLTLSDNLNDFLFNIIKSSFNNNGIKYVNSLMKPKALIYNRIRINGKQIPLIVVLGYEYGLLNVLHRYNIEYIFTSTNKRPNIFNEETVKIKFKDGYLYYDNKKVRNSLLLSGLNVLDTNEFNITSFEAKGEPYIDYFSDSFGSRNIGKGISNNLSLFLDAKTKEVLEKMGLPTNMLDILLYTNTLLESNNYNRNNSMNNYRIRGTEQINAVLYKVISESYRRYKDTSKNGNPIKVSAQQDIVIKKLMESPTVDEASDLNPTLEIEKTSSITYKGISGVNSNDAFNNEFRAYDNSMKGILGMESPDSNKVGIVRTLTYNPNIVNTLGFIDTEAEVNGNTNMYSIAELLNNFSVLHSDPPRIGMQTQQQKHILEIEDTDAPLFGSGAEKAVPYLLSDVFTFKAKNDGVIKKIDKSNNLVILEYSDGSTDIINLNQRINKNSNGGFYINSSLELLLKEGDTFNKGEILAKDNKYMVGNNKDNISYSTGALSKVAVAASDGTYEDSSLISSKLTKRMKSKITMKKEMILGVNTNIDFMVKKGDYVKTGDPLITFENSFDDASINEFLEKLGSDFSEAINSMAKNTYRSKYTGKIVDIKIYYNRNIEEFSPSIQKILKSYISKNENLKKILINKTNKDSLNQINLPSTEKIDGIKIKGKEVDGILIEFYIEYEDFLGIGDKIAFYGPCKTIISDVLDERTEMAFKRNEKGEKEVLDAIFSPLSLVSRMTVDIYNALYLNKTIKGLKEKIRDIMNE